MESSLIVYGDILVEVDTTVESVPKTGQDAVVSELKLVPGGSAANCAAIAARLGARVKFIGLVGNDYFGKMVVDDLYGHGVDVSGIKVLDGSTASVVIMIEKSGEKTMLSYRGIAATTSYGSLPDSLIKQGDYLHISGYSFQTNYSRDTAIQLIQSAHKVQAKVSIDPSFFFAQAMPNKYENLFSEIEYFLPNETEAYLVTGTQNPPEAIKKLRELGINTVLLKMGERGCLLAHGDETLHLDGYPIRTIIDTTGAGDAFAGGFLTSTIAGCTLNEAARIGNAVAAIIVAEIGGHSAAPNIDQLLQFALESGDPQLISAIEKLGSQILY